MDFRENLYIIIGERIKFRRKELGMSQEDLSKALDLSRSSLSNIEMGRHQIPLITLYELSKTLSLDLYRLIPTLKEVKDSVDEKNSYQDLFLSQELDEKQYKHILNKIKKIQKNDD